MASAKQIAWRKKFAKMAKSGKFRKNTKSKLPRFKGYVETQTRKQIQEDTLIPTAGSRRRTAEGYKHFEKHYEIAKKRRKTKQQKQRKLI